MFNHSATYSDVLRISSMGFRGFLTSPVQVGSVCICIVEVGNRLGEGTRLSIRGEPGSLCPWAQNSILVPRPLVSISRPVFRLSEWTIIAKIYLVNEKQRELKMGAPLWQWEISLLHTPPPELGIPFLRLNTKQEEKALVFPKLRLTYWAIW